MYARKRIPVLTGLIAATALALTALSSPAQASSFQDDDPPTEQITIKVATVNGSGCAPGTAAVSVSPDNTAFTVTYSEYLAQAGGNSDPTDFRKNCQLNLEVHVPQGFTYAIATADYRGFAHLEPGATGMQQALYYFQGMSETHTSKHQLSAPASDNWQYTDETDVDQLVYKPCGEERNFNINTELRVGAGDDPAKKSFVAMDSTDGAINTIFNFSWKKCPV
ncbi:DUF4360 domain-containing protein [Stackebrandtia nassauensis]|uniref:Secreted protein n=1 Tax=Stackebrandtia nassauensis (strain DSM 44728 / CIP 108903 / NRRL B-16338 / NBRC 102104 / LLR-40K-21) TaxID=446470 RepID=D3Q0Q8_STANL|nr:DUF4360 domain-containing protein [Stackebrandtia nassauensis]ADD41794.1 conserved hypothetical protein [Stackebrandtia nassauensis DSM 44728]